MLPSALPPSPRQWQKPTAPIWSVFYCHRTLCPARSPVTSALFPKERTELCCSWFDAASTEGSGHTVLGHVPLRSGVSQVGSDPSATPRSPHWPLWWKELLSNMCSLYLRSKLWGHSTCHPSHSEEMFSASPGAKHLQWPAAAACCGDPAAIPTLSGTAWSWPGSRQQAGLLQTASAAIFWGHLVGKNLVKRVNCRSHIMVGSELLTTLPGGPKQPQNSQWDRFPVTYRPGHRRFPLPHLLGG